MAGKPLTLGGQGICPHCGELLFVAAVLVPLGKGSGKLAKRTIAALQPEPKPKRKTGRPRKGEVRDRPWEALGISKRTWQRRQKRETT